MKHKRVKSPVVRVVVFVFFVVVIALVAVRLNKESEMRIRVENRAKELEIEASEASAEYAEAVEMSRKVGTDDYIEEVARESLGMVMPGETVFEPNEK
ncbi:MAG: septum formation initiator family protein [Clostridiales bacterium]|nr:septum formation initiator family protein [Clostridiales bacterium]